MEADDLLSLMTLGTVAPYALEALMHWSGRAMKSVFGANAPTWFRLQGIFTRSA
jgi:hypothetical protein